ncbi:FecCD family ABC transporter permease [Bradyrhizobium iriomotense]|uniref:FecCD family ABC transporter permease n=1 Tax=Bradyrhizobium iriomotense TaxID=441950 RepID=UPI001B8A7561|nr:iron ABC transporter permease [Bradyrhizobium iriomotense]
MSAISPNLDLGRGDTSPDLQAKTAAAYRALMRRRLAWLALLALVALAAFVADLGTGPSRLGLAGALGGIFRPDSLAASEAAILWEVRLPQAVLAVLVGLALATAGAEMQTILDNPLASPFTLGVSSAASFGAALAIVLGIGIPGVPRAWLISANAFMFATIVVLVLQAVVRWRGSGTDILVLCGIALFFTFNALVALTQFLASQQALQQLVFWTMGSLSRASWDKLGVLAVALLATLPFAWRAAWPMMALRLGEDRARSLGINIMWLRLMALLRVSLMTSTAIAFVGTIGFVGLAGPHIARLAIGEDHRLLLPASALTGAAIMSLASVASKTIIPGVLLPIGVVTAMVGLPVFFSLIFSRRRTV